MTHLTRRSVLGVAAALPLASALPAAADVNVSLEMDAWAPVNGSSPTQSYWTGSSDRDVMRVGMGTDFIRGSGVWRSFLRFPLDRAAGLTVDRVSVHFLLRQAGGRWAQLGLYQVPDIDPATPLTWNTTSGNWTTLLDQQPAAASGVVEFSGDALIAAVQAAIGRGARDVSFGLRNLSSENDRTYWKGFEPATPSLYLHGV